MSKFSHPLMEDNINKQDRQAAIKFIASNPKTFTQGTMVEKFEKIGQNG